MVRDASQAKAAASTHSGLRHHAHTLGTFFALLLCSCFLWLFAFLSLATGETLHGQELLGLSQLLPLVVEMWTPPSLPTIIRSG